MEKKSPQFVVSETKNILPFLIIDKEGFIGTRLARRLQEYYLTVLVSKQELSEYNNIISIPYQKKIPEIPDDHYRCFVVVYTGDEAVLHFLPSIVKKAQSSASKVLFVTTLPFVTKHLIKTLSKHELYGVQTIVAGELFFQEDIVINPVNYFVHQAKAHGKLTLSDDGIGNCYPMFIDDLLSAIISLSVSHEKRKLMYLFPKEPISELTIARILQKNNPSLRIDFIKRKKAKYEYVIPERGEYFFATYPFEKRLDDLIANYEPLAESQLQGKSNEKVRSLLLFLGAVITALILPVIITFLLGILGFISVFFATQQLEQGNVSTAKQEATISETLFSTAKLLGGSLVYVDALAHEPTQYFFHQLSIGETIAKTEQDIIAGIELIQTLSVGKSDNPQEDVQKSLALFKHAVIAMRKLEADRSLPKGIATHLSQNDGLLTSLFGIFDSLPQLLGFDGERAYLILFQNNMELRPGGGFIGSYAIAKLKNGKLDSFTMHDVYDADGKLTTHIEPPFALRRYLGASHLFLRDSNYSIDFPTNAERAAVLLQQETGDTIDGVIAFDTSLLNSFISVFGPLKLLDYQETMTEKNAFMITETHVEKNFFPGSTQKKDFLGALTRAITAKLSSANTGDYLSFARKLGELIQKKHILFAFTDPSEQQLFTVNHLSSSLWDDREKKAGSFYDFLGIDDMNLGTNKVNYYISRSLEQHISFTESGDMTTTAFLTYTNTSEKNSPFGGDYKNYLRFIVPKEASLHEVRIDGKNVETTPAIIDPKVFTAKRFVPPQALEVEMSEEQGRKLIGFLVMVPIGKTTTVSITYSSPQVFSPADASFTYDLSLFKQPGTQDDPYALFIRYPATYQFATASKGLSDVGGKLIYSSYLTGDKHLFAVFSKK